MSDDFEFDSETEELLFTLDQVQQTVEVMAAVIDRLKDRIYSQQNYPLELKSQEELLEEFDPEGQAH